MILHLLCCDIVVGLHWSNINSFSSVDDNFTMLNTLIMLIVDIFFYSIVTWYLDALLPGNFGTPLPFYFPFMVHVFFNLIFCVILVK